MPEVRTDRPKSNLLNLPNQLTIARLLLAIVWFVALALVGRGSFSEHRSIVLNICTVFFIIAICTDFLDGYIARKWNMESTFGRIADPFVDKIVICGGFIMLTEISDLVEPWYPVLLVLREFLVSGLRSYIESAGKAFGAQMSGKLKMIFQSIAIPAVIVHEANFRPLIGEDATGLLASLATPFEWLTIGLLGVTMVLTFASCVGYIRRAAVLLRD
jgi:CDP-diacylglycerol--glycerol-3-phosphate 3-phosphatidyltransferase